MYPQARVLRLRQCASLLLVGTAILLLALSWILRLGHPFRPAADSAILEINVEDAVHGRMLVGPYSRFGWNHPGPLLFYALAPLYYLFGRNPVALHLGMALINGLSVFVSVLLVQRTMGERAGRWVALVALLFLIGVAPHGLSQLWNPNALAAPLLCFLVLCAVACTGNLISYVAAALVGSFLVQTHVGTVGVVGGLLAGAFPFLWRARAASKSLNVRLLVALAALLLLVWLPPLIEGENLWKIAKFFATHQGATGAHHLWLSCIAFVRQAGAIPFGIETFPLEVDQISEIRALMVLISVLLACATAWIAFQRRQLLLAALSGVSVVGCLLGMISVTRAEGPLLSYLFWWCAALVVPAWMAWGVAIQHEVRGDAGQRYSVTRMAMGLAMAAALGWFAKETFRTRLALYPHSDAGYAVATHILKRRPEVRSEGVELFAQAGSYTNYAATYATLRRMGVDAVVPPSWAGNFGPQHISGSSRPSPRYVAYMLDAGTAWVPAPQDLPTNLQPETVRGVQVWLIDRGRSGLR